MREGARVLPLRVLLNFEGAGSFSAFKFAATFVVGLRVLWVVGKSCLDGAEGGLGSGLCNVRRGVAGPAALM